MGHREGTINKQPEARPNLEGSQGAAATARFCEHCPAGTWLYKTCGVLPFPETQAKPGVLECLPAQYGQNRRPGTVRDSSGWALTTTLLRDRTRLSTGSWSNTCSSSIR